MIPTATASSTTAATTPPACRTRDGRTAGTGSRSSTVRCPKPPIGLVEVQGYAYAALLGAAELADVVALGRDATELRRRAADLRERWNDVMWDRRGWFALGRRRRRSHDRLADDEPRPCAVVRDRRSRVGRPLPRSPVRTGAVVGMGPAHPRPRRWAPMTRSATTTARCGRTTRRSARPGAARYGRWDVVDKIVDGALAAATHFGGRPPELFAGIAREEVPMPVSYPASCSPQAWSSASVLLLVRVMLGLEPTPTGVELRRREFGVDSDDHGVGTASHDVAGSTSTWPTASPRSPLIGRAALGRRGSPGALQQAQHSAFDHRDPGGLGADRAVATAARASRRGTT